MLTDDMTLQRTPTPITLMHINFAQLHHAPILFNIYSKSQSTARINC